MERDGMTGKARLKEELEFFQYDGDYDGLKNFCPGGTVTSITSKKGEDPVWILCGKHYNLTELNKGDYVVKDAEGYIHTFTPERFKEKFEVTE